LEYIEKDAIIIPDSISPINFTRPDVTGVSEKAKYIANKVFEFLENDGHHHYDPRLYSNLFKYIYSIEGWRSGPMA
jgi:hypothetical protein